MSASSRLLVALAVLGLAGCTAAPATPVAGGPATTVTATETVPPAAASTAPTVDRSPDPTTTRPSGTPTVPPPDWPAGYVGEPARAGLDFGLLLGVEQRDGRTVLVVDRARMLTGDQAADYSRVHHLVLRNDYLIVNDNPTLRRFPLAPGAVLFGTETLVGDPDHADPTHPERLSAATLTRRAAAWFAGIDPDLPRRSAGIDVWLRHDGGVDGPVSYLGEQWEP